MKAMKYVGLVSLATVALGFATPVGAEVDGESNSAQTEVTVEVEGSNFFTLQSVPDKYNFSTTVKGEDYTVSVEGEKNEGGEKASVGTFGVLKGYSANDYQGYKILASLSALMVNPRYEGEEGEEYLTYDRTITGHTTTIGNKTINSRTGNGQVLFEESDFGSALDSGNLTKDIDTFKLNFSDKDLKVNDELLLKVVYTVQTAP